MPVVHECSARGCSTLTMGRYCIEHEHPVLRPRRLAAAVLAAAIAGAVAAFLARTRLSL